MVVLSSIFWAAQPAFLLTVGRHMPDNAASFLLLNVGSLTALSFAVTLFLTKSGEIRRLFSSTALIKKFSLIIAIDAMAVTAAYVFLIISARNDNLAASAIFFETWPIFVGILLFCFSNRPEDKTLPIRLALILFTAGIYFIHLAEGTVVSAIGSIDAALPLISAFAMASGVFVIQMFLRRHSEFTDARAFTVVIAARSFCTLICVTLVFLFTPSASIADLRLEFIFASVGFGIVVFATTMLYHIGVAKAKSNAVSLVALLSPVFAPAFLFAIGLGVPSLEFFVGAAFIIAGLSVTARTKDNTPQFQILLLLILTTGTVIVFVDGVATTNYYVYMQTIAVFYGLLQTSALTRLYGRYSRAKQLALEVRALNVSSHTTPRSYEVLIRKQELRSIKSEVSSASELLLLSLLAIANFIMTIIARDNSLESDTIAYLIIIASCFMVLICWYYQVRIMVMTSRTARRLSIRPPNVLASRSFSYIVSSTLFFWMLFVIVFKHKPL